MELTTALLVIAHGSREEAANADLHHIVAALRPGHGIVEAAYLELAEPTIAAAAAACVRAGATRVVLVPYFLSAGVHVRRDLGAARQRLAEQHAGVEFLVAEPLGRHPLLLEVLQQRVREACTTPKRGE